MPGQLSTPPSQLSVKTLDKKQRYRVSEVCVMKWSVPHTASSVHFYLLISKLPRQKNHRHAVSLLLVLSYKWSNSLLLIRFNSFYVPDISGNSGSHVKTGKVFNDKPVICVRSWVCGRNTLRTPSLRHQSSVKCFAGHLGRIYCVIWFITTAVFV